MRIQSRIHPWDHFFLVSTFIILILIGIGIDTSFILVLVLLNVLAALIYKYINIGKIEIPKNYFLYVIFLLVLLVHTRLFHGNILFLQLLSIGGLLWLEVYNFRRLFAKYFAPILITLGMLMSGIYIYSLRFPVNLPNLLALFKAPPDLARHVVIGDLWAVILVAVFYLFFRKKSYFYLPLIGLGLYFLAISYSRSALLALAVGIFYIFQKSVNRKKLKNIILVLFVIITALFVYFATVKSLLFSRVYFFQAIIGFFRFPLGTGIGNFTYLTNLADLVHDLPLEVFSGMGIFSVVFLVWLYKILKQMLTVKKINVEAVAIFLAILIDFCFYTTYTIPIFIGIWFLSLALTENTT
ncbi:MAG: hypothetical protein ABSE04_03670 [Candidatus Microgenomates bacterium]